MLNSSAMLAVAGLRSRASRTISVRPPLSSVMSRSAADVHAVVAAARACRRLRSGPRDRRHGRRHRGNRRRSAGGNGNGIGSGGGCGGGGARVVRRSPRRRCRPRTPALRSRGSAVSARGCSSARGIVAVRDHQQRLLPVWPVCASGTASATASYIAVPPFGVRRPSARDSAARSRRPVLHSTGTLLKR